MTVIKWVAVQNGLQDDGVVNGRYGDMPYSHGDWKRIEQVAIPAMSSPENVQPTKLGKLPHPTSKGIT